jgi:phage tail sheath protein FI
MPVTPTYPGVYVQEIPSGVHTITGVATSIGAFVDYFKEGPANKAVQIFGMTDFNREFGGLDKDSEASYAIQQFFLNGGSEAHVIRVAKSDTIAFTKASVKIKSAPTGGTEVLEIEAISEGVWGNNLSVDISNVDSDAKTFDMTVTRFESTALAAKALVAEKYLGLSTTPSETRYVTNVVNESKLIRVTHISSADATKLPAPCGTRGGDIADITQAKLDGLSEKKFKLKVGSDVANEVEVTLGKWGSDDVKTIYQLASRVQSAIRAAAKTAGDPPWFPDLTVELSAKKALVLKASRGDPGYSHDALISVSAATPSAVGDLGLSGAAQNVQEYRLGLGTGTSTAAMVVGAAGSDGELPGSSEILGSMDKKSGMYALEDVDIFNILCIPRAADLEASAMVDLIGKAQKYCQDRRAFMIVDIPKNINEVAEMKDWMEDNDNLRHRNAAIYFPRLMMPDPLNEYRLKSVGASGTMAGLYARTDTNRGVWKAPAGTEATLRGISRLDIPLTDAQNGTLNPLGINCVRTFPIYGTVCWGGRTLHGADQQASEWKYIPIRRLALFLEESLFRGTKWVVFEPNDEPLWAKIRLNVGAFMARMFRQGAFQGSTPQEAYFVKCDAETTPQSDRDLGIVNIEVGFAPLKPAEFVILKIQQIPGEL